MNCIINRQDFSPHPEVGEIAQTEDGAYQVWDGNKWKSITMEGSGLQINLYDMNKQIVAQLPDKEDFTDILQNINLFKIKTNNKYYMLYGKEISYFTLFHCGNPKSTETFEEAVIDCLNSIGPIKSIDLTEDGNAIEIWVMSDNEATCLYLFPYDDGVVEVY